MKKILFTLISALIHLCAYADNYPNIVLNASAQWEAEIDEITNGLPTGWGIIGGSHGDTSYTFGPANNIGGARMMKLTDGSAFAAGMYFCQRDATITTEFVYGLADNHHLTLQPGNYQLSYNILRWKDNDSGTCGVVISDIEGNTQKSVDEYNPITPYPSNGIVVDSEAKTIEFTITVANDYLIKFITSSGWQGVMLCNIVLKSDTPTTSICDIEKNASVVRTEYFNLAGQRINATPDGIRIIKQTFSDGTTKVTKIMK